MTNAFVAYDDKTEKDSVTLEERERHADSQRQCQGHGRSGCDQPEQLKDAGLKTDASGNATNAFVAYDDKTKKDSVTLEGASGTQIHKVAKPARPIRTRST